MSNKRITLRKGCVIRYADTPEALAKLKKMGYKEVDSKPVKVETEKSEESEEPGANEEPGTEEESKTDEKPKPSRRNNKK